jgi:hypothetical protein
VTQRSWTRNLGLLQPTRPIDVTWDAPASTVASALEHAIAEPRYDDAGHSDWPFWRAFGSVTDHAVDLRMIAYQAPEMPSFGFGLQVRGDLLPDHGGTRLMGSAFVPLSPWEKPLIAGMSLWLAGFPAVLVALEIGVVQGLGLFVAVLAAVLLVWAIMLRLGSNSYLGAAPQVEAVLASLGTSSGRGDHVILREPGHQTPEP